jgi:septal ring factor EnvC (AmiA/AmiB activator)
MVVYSIGERKNGDGPKKCVQNVSHPSIKYVAESQDIMRDMVTGSETVALLERSASDLRDAATEAEKLEQRLVKLERDMITQQQRTSSLEDKLEKMYPNIARVEAEERRVFEQRRETPEETAARHARE